MNKTESPISINEHLSALLDEEAGSFEQRRVLDELKSNQSLSKKLSSYALIGETMRAGDSANQVLSLGTSFLDGIHEKIALEDDFNKVVIGTGIDTLKTTEQATQIQESSNSFSWLRPIGGFAVAASVGALSFMGLQNMGLLSNPNMDPSNIVNSSAPTAIVQSATAVNQIVDTTTVADSTSVIVAKSDQYVDADAQTRSLLKRYVDSHMQYATSSSAFVPSVRAIAYASNQ